MAERSYRLERRREIYIKKWLLSLTALALVAGLSIVCGRVFAAAKDKEEAVSSAYKYYKSVEISEGDTLWSIAEEYADGRYASTRDYVYELKEINNLSSDHIQEGQYLTIAYFNDMIY